MRIHNFNATTYTIENSNGKTQYEYSILCNIIINQGFEINHRCIPPVY